MGVKVIGVSGVQGCWGSKGGWGLGVVGSRGGGGQGVVRSRVGGGQGNRGKWGPGVLGV